MPSADVLLGPDGRALPLTYLPPSALWPLVGLNHFGFRCHLGWMLISIGFKIVPLGLKTALSFEKLRFASKHSMSRSGKLDGEGMPCSTELADQSAGWQ